MNIVKALLRTHAGRDPLLLARKYALLRDDPFRFLRGTNALFLARLPDAAVLRKAPRVWACGDLHLENIGSYRGVWGQACVDLNDFDDAGAAPATLDLLRLLVSLRVGRRALALPGHGAGVMDGLCGHLVDAWADALRAGKARQLEPQTASAPLAALQAAVHARSVVDFLARRLTGPRHRPRLKLRADRIALATPAERAVIEAAFPALVAAWPADAGPAPVELLDVAQRIAGTGSLGLQRHVLLVRQAPLRGRAAQAAGALAASGPREGRLALLDLKQAVPTPLARAFPALQPVWPDEAARVVTLQRRLQATEPAGLQTWAIDGVPRLLRALQPGEDKLALADGAAPWSTPDLHALLGDAARCLAWAQLRSSGRQGAATADELGDFVGGARWRGRLLDLARELAVQVEADWRTYGSAYDQGAFATSA